MLQLRDIDIPEDKVVIDIIKNQFYLDNGKVVDDPVGALSSTVTVTGQVILADRNYIRQLTNIFKNSFWVFFVLWYYIFVTKSLRR